MPPALRNMGYIPDSIDSRDKIYEYKGDVKLLEGMPASKSLLEDIDSSKLLEGVYDQSASGSCVANATAGAIRFLSRKNASSPESALDPSRLFVYYNARALRLMSAKNRQWPADLKGAADWGSADDNHHGGGTSIRSAMKSINLFGVASEEIWPFQVQQQGGRKVVLRLNDRPTDAAYLDAKNMRAVEYSRLDPQHPPEEEKRMGPLEKNADGILTLARLKQSIVEGLPVVFGFFFYYPQEEAFEPAPAPCPCHGPDGKGCVCCCGCSQKTKTAGFPIMKDIPWDRVHRGPAEKEGHAVMAIGYEDAPGDSATAVDGVLTGYKGRVLCQNSWGSDEGSTPYFWLPYSYIIDFEATQDFWILRQLEPPAKVAPLTLESGWSLRELPFSKGAAPKSGIATLSRSSQESEVFWISPDGSVNGAVVSYRDNKPARRFSIAGSGSARVGAIAAVSCQLDRVDVLWIGKELSIEGASLHGYDDGATWKRYSLSGTYSVVPETQIAAVSRAPDRVDVWWTAIESVDESLKLVVKGRSRVLSAPERRRRHHHNHHNHHHNRRRHGSDDGSSDDSSSNSNDGASRPRRAGKWSEAYLLDNPANEAEYPTGNITAISRGDEHMEVYWSRGDGSVHCKTYESAWKKSSSVVAPEGSVCTLSSLAAVAPEKLPTQLVSVAPDGSVLRWCKSDEAGSAWDQNVMAPINSARVDAGIAAVLVVDQTRLDVVWVRPNNSVAGLREDTGETYTIGQSGTALSGSPLAAVRTDSTNWAICFGAYEAGFVVANTAIARPDDTTETTNGAAKTTNGVR